MNKYGALIGVWASTGMVTIGIDTSKMTGSGELPCRIVVNDAFIGLHPGRRVQLISGMVDYIRRLAAAVAVGGQVKVIPESQIGRLGPDAAAFDVVAVINVQLDEREGKCEIDAELNGGWANLAPWQHSKLYAAIIELLLGTGMTIARRDMAQDAQNQSQAEAGVA